MPLKLDTIKSLKMNNCKIMSATRKKSKTSETIIRGHFSEGGKFSWGQFFFFWGGGGVKGWGVSLRKAIFQWSDFPGLFSGGYFSEHLLVDIYLISN